MLEKAALVERIAEIEHAQWIAWSKKLAETEPISTDRKERWERLWIPYSELSEAAKEQDREWARKVVALVEPYFKGVSREMKFGETTKVREIYIGEPALEPKGLKDVLNPLERKTLDRLGRK